MPGRFHRHASPRAPRKTGHRNQRDGERVPEGRQPSPPILPRPCKRERGSTPGRPPTLETRGRFRYFELSLQSALHRSIALLVRYRSRAGIFALRGVDLAVQAAVPRSSTRWWARGVPRPADGVRLCGAFTLGCAPFQATLAGQTIAAPRITVSAGTSPPPITPHLRRWEPPTVAYASADLAGSGMGRWYACSFAITETIAVAFCSSAD